MIVSFGFFANLTQAQSDKWVPITGADTLRNLIIGKTFERDVRKGDKRTAEYFADGTGVLRQSGATFKRTWRIKGDNQFCVTISGNELCYTMEQNADDPNLYRVKESLTGKLVEIRVVEGRGVAKGPPKELGKEGAPAAASAAEVAAQLANPNTPMATMTFKLQFRSFEGTLPNANDQSGTTLLLQPSLPFPLANGASILWRPALPILIDQPVFNAANQNFEEVTGIGDFAFDLAYARTSETGLLTAFGIIASLPIATDDRLGSDQYTLGPEFMLGKLTSKYVIGMFPNHQWGFGGDGPTDINLTSIQLFGTYIPGGGWTVGTAPTMTYEHNSEQWTIPWNLNVGKTVVWNGRPWKLGAEINYYSDKPDAFGPKWMIGFSIAPVVRNAMADWFK